MAALSTRVDVNTDITIDVENHEVYYSNCNLNQHRIACEEEIRKKYEQVSVTRDFSDEEQTNILKQTQENTNMNNTFRTLNITLIDLSQELKGEKKVVFEKQNVRTEYSDEQTKMNLVAKGKVLKALEDHNENVRAKTLDYAYKGSAREVFLEPIDHLGDSRLQWEIVRVG